MKSPVRGVPIWLAILTTSLPMFMATLDNLVVTNALPAIHEDLGASIEDLQWITNAYTLAFASLMLLAVALGDRFGRRRVFLAGIVVFTLASAGCALSTDPQVLVVARAVEGVGAAAVMPLSLTLLVTAVTDRQRPLAIGIWGGVSGLGVALGPLIGGAVVEAGTWESIFWLNVPVGVVALVLAVLVLAESRGHATRPDLVGVALAGLGILGIVFGVVRGNDAGWSSTEVVTAILAGGVLLGLFVVWQAVASEPLLPLRLFRERSFTVANIVAAAFSAGTFGSVFILIQFMQIVQGRSPLEAGVETMPWTMAPVVVAPLTGLLVPRFGTRLLIVVGLVLLAVGLFATASALSATVPYLRLLPGFVLAGIGMGLVFSPISTAVLAHVSADDNAKASGTNATLREIGVALGIAVLTAIFVGAGGSLTPDGYIDAAVPAVLVGASAVAASALVALFLPARAVKPVRQTRPAG